MLRPAFQTWVAGGLILCPLNLRALESGCNRWVGWGEYGLVMPSMPKPHQTWRQKPPGETFEHSTESNCSVHAPRSAVRFHRDWPDGSRSNCNTTTTACPCSLRSTYYIFPPPTNRCFMTHLAAAPTYPSGSIWHTHLRQISWIHGQGPVTLSARRHEGARCCNVMMPKAAQMEQQEGAPSQRFCATLPQMPKSCLPRLNPPPKPHMKWLRHRRVVSKAQLNLNLPKSCAPCARHAALTFYSLFFFP